LLPISPVDRKAIEWGYSRPRDSEGWAISCGERTSKPKQSVLALLSEFSSEVDKWQTVRRNGEYEDEPLKQHEPWTAERWRAANELYPHGTGLGWPSAFGLLESCYQEEIDALVKKNRQRENTSDDST